MLPAAPSQPGPGRPKRPGQRLLGLTAAAATLLGLAAVAFLGFERHNLEQTRLGQAELYADVLEADTTRELQATLSVLKGLSQALTAQGRPTDEAGTQGLLTEPLRDRPGVRSLAVLDEEGLVLASTTANAAGLTVPLDRLEPVPSPIGRGSIGPLVMGRDERDLATASGARHSAVTALPMQLAFTSAEGERRILLALLNPDRIASEHDRMLQPLGWRSAVLSLDGRLVSASSAVQRSPGGAPLLLPPFRDYLPQRESGSYLGAGIDGPDVLTAFRASRYWPLVVVVELDHAAVHAELRTLAGVSAGLVLLMWSLLAAVALVQLKALRRKQAAEQELAHRDLLMRASEARKQAILQSSLDAIVTIDSPGNIIDFNAAAEQMFGISSAEALGRPMHEVMVPHHHRQGHQAGMARYLSTRVSHVLRKRIEVQGLRADGSVFPVELTVVPVQTVNGEIFTATLRDITEKQRTERALIEREEALQTMFEHAAVGMLRRTEDGRFLDVNHALCQMLGFSRETLLLKPYRDGIHPDDLPASDQAFHQLSTGAVPTYQLEKRYRRKDGSYLWVRMSASMAPATTGRLPYMIGIVEDIEARKTAEQERIRLLDRISQALTGMERQRLALDQHAIVSIANAEGVITYANSKLLQVSGYSENEIIGRTHSLMLPGAPGKPTQPAVWRDQQVQPLGREIVDTLRQHRVWEGELLHQKKDGSTFWAASTVVPMRGADGALEEVFVIQTDVTKRIHAEQALASAREAEVQMGARIQQALLVTPPDQRLPKTWISSVAHASKGIDGDFVDVLTVGEHCVDIVLGDVMGKGMGAALIGAAAKMQLGHCVAELMARKDGGSQLPQPKEIVSALHRAMAPNLLALESFITLVYLRLDTQNDTVTWVGCGHEESVIVRADGGQTLLANQHPPMGVLDRMDYGQETTPLAEGDALFVCSDGVTDAIRSDGQRVGRPAVLAKVADLRGRHATPAAVLQAFKRDLLGKDVRLTDDMTMLLAVRTGGNATQSRRELTWHMTEIENVRGLVQHRAQQAGLDETTASLYTLACVEAFTNVVRHTTGPEPGAPIEMVVQSIDDTLSTSFIYLGDAFEPPQLDQVTTFDHYPEGGFGATIMQRATDLIEYERADGVNLVRLVRHC